MTTKTLNALLRAGLLGLTGSAIASETVSPNALAPCINARSPTTGSTRARA